MVDDTNLYGESTTDSGRVTSFSADSTPKDTDDSVTRRWKEAITQMDYGFDVNASTVFLFGEIADGSLYDLISKIRTVRSIRGDFTSDQKTFPPITILINSDGGDVYETLGMIDYINSLDCKVNTVCRGRAMSAAALLLCNGTGIRAASSNSTIMFHQISSGIYGKSNDMRANAQHMEKLEEILLGLVTKHSNKDKKFWEDAILKDYYITPEEALQLGVIDKVI